MSVPNVIHCIDDTSVEICNIQDMCNELNNYFVNVAKNLSSYDYYLNKYKHQICEENIFISPVTQEELQPLLSNLDKNKA